MRPSHRRCGTGGALLRSAAQQAAQNGRMVLWGETFKGSAGEAFARYVGAKASLADARRVLVVVKVPAGRIAALRESAARAAAGTRSRRGQAASPV